MIINRLANAFEKSIILKDIPSGIIPTLSRFNALLAGGSLLSILFNVGKINDFDFYFRKEKDFDIVNQVLNRTYFLLNQTNNAYTWGSRINGNDTPIQTIKIAFGEPETILGDFDLGVCKIGYDLESNKLYYDENIFNYLDTKTTNVSGFERPASTVFRVLKYMDKGFKPDYMDMVRLGVIISSFDISELIKGFDKGYFSPYIETTGLALKKYPELKKILYNHPVDIVFNDRVFLTSLVAKIMESL